jgi:hypothetical protein
MHPRHPFSPTTLKVLANPHPGCAILRRRERHQLPLSQVHFEAPIQHSMLTAISEGTAAAPQRRAIKWGLRRNFVGRSTREGFVGLRFDARSIVVCTVLACRPRVYMYYIAVSMAHVLA